MTPLDELVAEGPLDAVAAKFITDRIKGSVENTWFLIQQAYAGQAWKALGYSSWDAYTEAEFAGGRLAIPSEERQAVVGSLRDAGLSIRAIASATGLGVGTIHRELDAGVPNGTPAGCKIEGADGKRYAATRPAPVPHQQEAATDSDPSEGDVDEFDDGPLGHDEGAAADEVASDSGAATGAAASVAPVPEPPIDLSGFRDPVADWQADFAKALYRSGLVLTNFPAERVIENASEDEIETMRRLADGFARWVETVTKGRTGLRSIKGGRA